MRYTLRFTSPLLIAAFVASCADSSIPAPSEPGALTTVKRGQWGVVSRLAAIQDASSSSDVSTAAVTNGVSRLAAIQDASSSSDVSTTAVTNGAFANGSFETGNYAGWTLFEGGLTTEPTFGTWGIATNGQTIPALATVHDYFDNIDVLEFSPGLPHTYTATDGNFVSLQLQNGPQTHRMYQDIALPVGVRTISWDMEYNNHAVTFVPTQQEMAINVRDPNTDALIAPLFITTPASPPVIPMTHFTGDVTAFAGQTVRISVDHTVNLFYFDAAWDNFKVDFIVATNKDQCKNDGWMNVRRADGSMFKNQGDCIQYVNTGK
jgi:hypothetical protein